MIEDDNGKLEQLHTRLQGCEAGHGDLKRAHADKDQSHATLAERIVYLEKALGDSADKHARELEVFKNDYMQTTRDHQNRHGTAEQIHDTIASRLVQIEKVIG